MSKRFNLYEDTGHACGIIIFPDEQIAVDSWGPRIEDDVIPWLGEAHEKLKKVKELDDVRPEIPGSISVVDGVVENTFDIISDSEDDILAMFGFKTGNTDPDIYTDLTKPYSGTVWMIGDIKIITVDFWN